MDDVEVETSHRLEDHCVLGIEANDLPVELELMSSKNKNTINLMMYLKFARLGCHTWCSSWGCLPEHTQSRFFIRTLAIFPNASYSPDNLEMTSIEIFMDTVNLDVRY